MKAKHRERSRCLTRPRAGGTISAAQAYGRRKKRNGEGKQWHTKTHGRMRPKQKLHPKKTKRSLKSLFTGCASVPYIFYLSERLKNNDLPKRSKSMSKRKEKAGDKRFHRSNLPPALISLYSYLNRWLSYQNLCKGQEP